MENLKVIQFDFGFESKPILAKEKVVKPTKKDKDYTHAINHSPDIGNKNIKSVYDDYIIAPFNKDKWTSKDASVGIATDK